MSLVYQIKINEINFMEKKKENGLNKTKIASDMYQTSESHEFKSLLLSGLIFLK